MMNERIVQASRPTSDYRRQRSQKAALRRMVKLWDPLGKKLSLAGIRLASGGVTSDSGIMLSQLAAAWEPVFSAKDIDVQNASSMASTFSSKFDFSTSRPPSSSSFSRFLLRAQHSGPGMDGIPYTAYAKSITHSSRLLFEVSAWLRSGQFMLLNFNDTMKIFIHKGEEETMNTKSSELRSLLVHLA